MCEYNTASLEKASEVVTSLNKGINGTDSLQTATSVPVAQRLQGPKLADYVTFLS